MRRLLRSQIEALFTHDAAGRIVTKDKPVHAPAPRLFVGRSLAGNLRRYCDDVPAWRLPDRPPATRRAILVTPDDAKVLRPNYPGLAENLAAMSPCAAVMEHGVAVSVCFSALNSPSVAEAGLDTVASSRGRDYGAAAVAAWASALRETGRIPLSSTSWDNLASRRVAEKLGATQYGVDLSIY